MIAQLKQYPANEIVLCSAVLAELWFGAERSTPGRRANNLKLIDELAVRYTSLPFDNAAARHYAAIRAHLTTTGQLIGPNDLMIAAIARAHEATLVTSNTAEFTRVPNLSVIDWLSQ